MLTFTLGSNGSGQLGLGHTHDISQPTLAPGINHTPIQHIACGGNHIVVLHTDGTAESYGANHLAESSCQVSMKELSPTKGANPPRIWKSAEECQAGLIILQISATWSATIFNCSSREIRVCGKGLSGELGLGEGITDAPNPRTIPDFPPAGLSVQQLASGIAHTVAVLSNGDVWGWGKGRQGQLGEPAGEIWSPRRISGIPFAVEKVVCGKDFTLLIGDRQHGNLHLLGLNKSDRFQLRASMPAAVHGWKDVAASWGGVFVLTQDGRILGFGRDDHGQLPPAELPPVKAVAAGSEHCLALTEDDRVLAWGWGEHGNCGEPTDEHGDVRGRWNELVTPFLPQAIFAGCATSFIVTHNSRKPQTG